MVKKNGKRKTLTIVRVQKKKNNTKQNKEVTLLGGLLRNLGGFGGRMAGNYVGMGDAGSAAGRGLGASLSRWLGAGDYSVGSNSLVSRFKGSGSIPNMHKNGQSITVRHKEYITDVIAGSGAPSVFTVFNTYPLNPGISTTFPWLSSIAQQFQEYTFKGIVFHYVSTSGQSVASTNTALGSVMMATQYRATAPAYTNKQVMLNEYFSSDAKPAEDFCHPIECNPKENPYNVQYVRSAAVPVGEDQKTYDLGVMSFATEGLPASAIDCGELWVTYEVELRKPIPNSEEETFGFYSHWQNNSGVAASTPFGTIGNGKFVDSSVQLTLTTTKMTFPLGTIGTYSVLFVFNSVTVFNAANWITGGILANMSATLNVYGTGNSTNGAASTYTANGTGQAMVFAYFTIPDNTLLASFIPNFTTMTGVASIDMYISQVQLGST